MTDSPNRRILLVDDTPAIHEDFKKILCGSASEGGTPLAEARAGLFGGEVANECHDEQFELVSAHQGQEALELMVAASEAGEPYAMAFVDIRMPPGWDGVETIKKLWEVDRELQVVICTAFSDYSWEQTIAELGQTERLLILKKPFDPVEIRQLASAMTATWNAARREQGLMEELRTKEAEARAYSASLETMNKALLTAKAASERTSELKTEFLVHLSTQVGVNLSAILPHIIGGDLGTEFERAVDSSQDLMETLDRILDLARLETRDMELAFEPSPVVELFRAAVARRQADAAAAGINLDFHLPRPVPELVECDAQRLCQVLDQLIDNAVRYSGSGTVRTTLTHEPTGDWSRTRLVLTVVDEGPGVPEDVRGRLFEPFAGRPGAGLGLTLARELMLLMDGELSHSVTPTGGACFRASLEVGNLSGVRMVEG